MLLTENIAVYSGIFTNFAAKYFKNKIRIMTANEKWHGSSKNTSNSGAGRDGKSKASVIRERFELTEAQDNELDALEKEMQQ